MTFCHFVFVCIPGCNISIQWHPNQAAGTGYMLRLGLGLADGQEGDGGARSLGTHRSCGMLRAAGLF